MTEWLLHLPALDLLLGFPVQLVGVLVLPSLILRYTKDGKSVTEDMGNEITKIAKLLPGLGSDDQ